MRITLQVKNILKKIARPALIFSFVYSATTDSVAVAAEKTTEDAMWPFLDMAKDAAEYASGPLTRAVEVGQEHRERQRCDPNNADYRPPGNWPKPVRPKR